MRYLMGFLVFLSWPSLILATGLQETFLRIDPPICYGQVREAIETETHASSLLAKLFWGNWRLRTSYFYSVSGELLTRRACQLSALGYCKSEPVWFVYARGILLYAYTGNEPKPIEPRTTQAVVDASKWTITSRNDQGTTVYQFTEDYGVLLSRTSYHKSSTRSDLEAVEIQTYHYDQDRRLISANKKVGELEIAEKTAFYDGIRRSFSTPYFIDSLKNRGHIEIDVYDGEKHIMLSRRRMMGGDLPLEEESVETIEYTFDARGNEADQRHYTGGRLFLSFRSEYFNFDKHGNWTQRRTYIKNVDGKEELYNRTRRRMSYYGEGAAAY